MRLFTEFSIISFIIIYRHSNFGENWTNNNNTLHENLNAFLSIKVTHWNVRATLIIIITVLWLPQLLSLS
jgi:hypothetical protein